MRRKKSIIWIILSRFFGLVFFLILLLILNALTFYFNNYAFNQVVQFLNNNIGLIVIMTLIFLVGELFNALIFPVNLPAPLFSAIGSVLVVLFIFRIFTLIESLLGENIFQVFRDFSSFIYALVFIIVLIAGYIGIFARLIGPEEEYEKVKRKKEPKATWEDIGDEFRQLIYDTLRNMRGKVRKR